VTQQWKYFSPYVTEAFKATLEQMVNDALKAEPELGLGYDPILNAQDYPEQGFTLASWDAATGRAVVQGIGWESFQITLWLVQQEGKTLVDGCGAVHAPATP